MPGCRLRKTAVGFHFYGMDEIGEFDGVLDEEYRDVVADQVPVSFLGVKLHREAAHIARCVDRTRTTSDRRDAGKHGGLLAYLCENFGGGVLLQRGGQFKKSVRAGCPCMHDPFGNPLVIKMGDFFAKNEVFQKRGTARICPERVLIVSEWYTLIGGECGVRATGDLMQLAAACAW